MIVETLAEYIERTRFMNWMPDEAEFIPHPQVGQKVSDDGGYKPFWGDTMLFWLDNTAISALTDIQQKLYNEGLVLAKPLNSQQLHMTLHDLSHTMGCDRHWDEIRAAAEAILSDLKNAEVALEPVRLFPMMNTSIVAGYRPATEEDCRVLMEWYRAFDTLFSYGQPTFHVTLAYFRPDFSGRMEMKHLKQALEAADTMPLPKLLLTKENLVYQRFLNMNEYYSPR